ncbi:hypothetical protein BHM03_00048689 [Ensete ventricosum]|nr:hypothetical protein BHM03_00048689 [Ensete ventricosum]
MCSDLAVEEVICVAHIDENGDRLMFKKSSNFHRLRVVVADQRVHCVVYRLGLFHHGFIFRFEASSDGSLSLSSIGSIMRSRPFLLRRSWSGSDPCPSYFMVQSFFLDSREGDRHHKSVRLSRFYFSLNLRL